MITTNLKWFKFLRERKKQFRETIWNAALSNQRIEVNSQLNNFSLYILVLNSISHAHARTGPELQATVRLVQKMKTHYLLWFPPQTVNYDRLEAINLCCNVACCRCIFAPFFVSSGFNSLESNCRIFNLKIINAMCTIPTRKPKFYLCSLKTLSPKTKAKQTPEIITQGIVLYFYMWIVYV